MSAFVPQYNKENKRTSHKLISALPFTLASEQNYMEMQNM